jgi:hypothetical protein
VKRRHDGTVVILLDRNRLCILETSRMPLHAPNSASVPARKTYTRAKNEQRERHTETERRKASYTTTAVTVDQPSGKWQGEDRADGHCEENDAELPVADRMLGFDRRNMRNPTCEYEPVNEEEGRHRTARRKEGCGCCC